MKGWIIIAMAAGFGGIAPNVFRLATDLQAGMPLPDLSYTVGVIMFFIMGAGVALAFGEDNAKKAFFLGLSLPAMFQSGASDVSAQAVAKLFSGSVVYAAEEAPEKRVIITYAPESPDFSFIFYGEKRGREERLLLDDIKTSRRDRSSYLEVPSWATSFKVVILDSKQESVSYSIFKKKEWKVDITEKSFRGFKQSIGIKDPERWEITVAEN